MTSKQAHYISTILETGSISAAAQKLYISQPSLSQTVQNVELELGVKIFNRSTTPITLTYAGEKCMEAARKILEVDLNLSRVLSEIKKEAGGRLKIGISSLRGATVLPPILSEFIQAYPLVKLEIVEKGSHELTELIEKKEVDIAFCLGQDEIRDNIACLPLFRERLILFAGPETAIARRIPSGTVIPIIEAKDETFIYIKKGHGIRTMQDKIFLDHHMNPNILFETESVVMAKQMAFSCNCVAFYSEVLMANETFLPTTQEIYYPIAGEEYTSNFYVCHHKDTYLTDYMKGFLAITQSYFNHICTIE